MKNIVMMTLALLIGIGAVFYLFPSNKRRVTQPFASLEAWAKKEGEETQLMSAAKMQRVKALFAPMCLFNDPAREMSGAHSNDDIAQKAVMARSRFAALSLSFYDLAIDFPELDRARVVTTVRLIGTSQDNEHIQETHELNCVLENIENTWVFSEVNVVSVLQK